MGRNRTHPKRTSPSVSNRGGKGFWFCSKKTNHMYQKLAYILAKRLYYTRRAGGVSHGKKAKIRKYQDSVALEPANKSYKTQIYNSERIKIQGRLVGLMRKY